MLSFICRTSYTVYHLSHIMYHISHHITPFHVTSYHIVSFDIMSYCMYESMCVCISMHVCNVMRCEYRMECNERQGKARQGSALQCNVYIYIYVCVYIYMCVCDYVYINIHTYIYNIYIYIYILYIYIIYICMCVRVLILCTSDWIHLGENSRPPTKSMRLLQKFELSPPALREWYPRESYHAGPAGRQKNPPRSSRTHFFRVFEPDGPNQLPPPNMSSMLKLPMSGMSWGWNGFVLRDISNIAN